jgi:hypothetical protein
VLAVRVGVLTIAAVLRVQAFQEELFWLHVGYAYISIRCGDTAHEFSAEIIVWSPKQLEHSPTQAGSNMEIQILSCLLTSWCGNWHLYPIAMCYCTQNTAFPSALAAYKVALCCVRVAGLFGDSEGLGSFRDAANIRQRQILGCVVFSALHSFPTQAFDYLFYDLRIRCTRVALWHGCAPCGAQADCYRSHLQLPLRYQNFAINLAVEPLLLKAQGVIQKTAVKEPNFSAPILYPPSSLRQPKHLVRRVVPFAMDFGRCNLPIWAHFEEEWKNFFPLDIPPYSHNPQYNAEAGSLVRYGEPTLVSTNMQLQTYHNLQTWSFPIREINDGLGMPHPENLIFENPPDSICQTTFAPVWILSKVLEHSDLTLCVGLCLIGASEADYARTPSSFRRR